MFHPKHPDTVKPEYMPCGVHIRKLASIIAIVKLVLGVLLIPVIILTHTWSAFLFIIFFFIAQITVLLADKFEKPRFYSPCLYITIFMLFAAVLYLVIAIPAIILIPIFVTEPIYIEKNKFISWISVIYSDNSIDPIKFTITLAISAVILIIYVVIERYCWQIIRRARTYMIDEVTSGKVQRNCAIIGHTGPSIA